MVLIVAAGAALVSAGCETARGRDHGFAPVERLGDDGFDAAGLAVHRGDASGRVSFGGLADALSGADVVLVGEVHGHRRGLDFIATLFEELARRDDALVLSMEFYERDHQVALDDYTGGLIDRAAFGDAADRDAGNNPAGHQRMVEASRAMGRRVIASNAPRRYARMARTEGYGALGGLSAAQRAMFEIPDALPEGAYAERFADAMGGMAGHGGDAMVRSFLRAQALWDATMAGSVADAAGRGARVFHVAGHFHVDFAPRRGGSFMADLVRERLGAGAAVRSVVVRRGAHASLMPGDVGAADFVVYAGAPAGGD